MVWRQIIIIHADGRWPQLFLCCYFMVLFQSAVLFLYISPSWSYVSSNFVPVSNNRRRKPPRLQLCELDASPKRLEENVDGILYVNDRCINCAACSNFAPTVFERNSDIYKHVVFHQPNIDKEDELESARAAMQACPVNAIKVDHKNNIVVEEREDEQEELKDALLSHDRSFPKSICPMILS